MKLWQVILDHGATKVTLYVRARHHEEAENEALIGVDRASVKTITVTEAKPR